MAIDKLLQESSFSQDEAASATAAYEVALDLLRLDDQNDPITERIAQKVIAVAKRSADRDPAQICAHAIYELGLPVPDGSITAHEKVEKRSSFRWREALLLLVIGAFLGYVLAQLNKAVDHEAVLARCKLQERTPDRLALCMRAAGYEFYETQCEGAENISEQQRLPNPIEVDTARLTLIESLIEQYLQKNPGQSRRWRSLGAKRRQGTA